MSGRDARKYSPKVDIFAPKTSPDFRSIIDVPPANDDRSEGRLRVDIGTEQHEETRAWLLNGTQVNIDRLVLRQWLDSRKSQMSRPEEANEEGADLEETDALARIEDSLRKERIEGEFVRLFAVIARSFGDQIGLVRKDKGSGMDRWKIGHRVEDVDMEFVIAESRKDDMLALLHNPPAESFADLQTNFNFTRYENYLHSDDGEQELGFVVKYEFTDKEGNALETKHIVFWYGQEDGVEEVANDDVEEVAKTTDL